MKKRFTYLLMTLLMCVTSAWAATPPYSVGTDLNSLFRDGESTAFTLSGDGTVTYTFTNHVNPENTDDTHYNWYLFCTNTSETKADADNTNRFFELRADGGVEISTATSTLSEGYSEDFMTWNDGATCTITITRKGGEIEVVAKSTSTEGGEYTLTFNYTLTNASADTKFFLANGFYNYLEVSAESSKEETYSTLYSRTIDQWSAADVTKWGGSSNLAATAGTGLVGTSRYDTESKIYGETYDGSIAISPLKTSKVTLTASLHGGAAPGRPGSYDYISLGGVSLRLNGQDKIATIVADGASTTLTGFTRDADYNVTLAYDGADQSVKYTITGGITASGSVTTTEDITKVSFGHYKAGREGYTSTLTLKNISVVEEKQNITTANYKVQFQCDGVDIKDASTRTGQVGNAITLSPSDTQSFFSSDNTKKYIYVSNDAAGKAIADDGSTVVTVTFREAATYAYTVKSSIGTDIATGSNFEGETISYAYPRYLNNNGTLYGAKQGTSGTYWGSSFTLTENNQIVTIDYTATTITDVQYFTETEDLAGATVLTTGNANVRCSKMAAGFYEGDLVTLPAGTYKIATSVFGTVGGTITFKAGVNEILSVSTTGSITDVTSEPFTLDEETTIKMSGGANSGNSPKVADFVYIVKAKPLYTYTIKAMDGEAELATVKIGKAEEGTEIYWSKYQKVGETWYELPSTYMTVSATEADNEIKLVATASNITYFVEGESMTKSHSAAATLTGADYSGGVSPRHYQSSYWYTPETIPAGTYKMKASYKNNNVSGTTLTINYLKGGALSDALATVTGASGTGTLEATNIVIPEGGAAFVINNANTFNSNLYIDYMTLEPYNPSAISNVNANVDVNKANGKFMKNGQLVIVKNGKQYNAAGACIK